MNTLARPAPRRATSLAAAVLLPVVVTVLGGCAEEPPCAAPEAGAVDPLVLAVSVHANAPAPALPGGVAGQVRDALVAGQPVRLIGIDGSPEEVPIALPEVVAANCAALDVTAARATNVVATAVRSTAADSDGNDLYGAVALAADLAAAEDWDHTRLLLLDSGLSDGAGAPVDMSRPGMLGADPAEVAEFAREQDPLDLSDFDVQLVSFGYSAPPQRPLSGQERTAVTSIWTEVFAQQGAEVSVLPEPRPATGPDTGRVTAVAKVGVRSVFEPPRPGRASSVLYREAYSGPIRFEPDSVDLVDPVAARRAVAPVAAWLAADEGRRVVVVGTTSSAGTAAGRSRLSLARAERIAGLLVATSGGRADRVRTIGLGFEFAWRVDDRTSSGELDPSRAALNRTVRITAVDPT